MDIAGYKTLEQIGIGGMATVYLAIQESLERKVALKIMRVSLTDNNAFSRRFLREAKIIAQLSHPNIIPVYDVGVWNKHNYIAMEFESGGELKSKLKNGISFSESIEIIKQIASALHYAHENGYVHRDVKPDNILFNAHNKALLSDFGVAKACTSDASITAAGTLLGTPLYMSPEQVQGKKTDARSDLYSLGVVIYELLTGQPPFTDPSPICVAVKHITEHVPNLHPTISHFQPLINKLLNKDPNQRYQSGNEIIEAIDRLLSSNINHPHNVKTENVSAPLVANQQYINKNRSRWGQWTVISLVCTSVLIGSILIINKRLNIELFSSMASTLDYTSTKIGNMYEEPQKQVDIPVEIEAIATPQQLTQEQTQKQLEQANSLWLENNWDAAKKIFQDVYQNQNQNEQARLGLLSISNMYLASAELSINNHNLSESISYIDQAKSAYHNNPDIERVAALYNQTKLDEEQRLEREQMRRFEQEQKRKEKALKIKRTKAKDKELSDIVARVDKALLNSPITVKMLADTQYLLKQAEMISENDKRINDIRTKLILAHVDVANQAISLNNYNRADFITDLGLKLSPQSAVLLMTKEDIQKRIKTEELVTKLITDIDNDLNYRPTSLQHLVSAFQKYKYAISLAPNRFALQEKQASIIQAYVEASALALKNKDYESANKITAKGLEIAPDNTTLSLYKKYLADDLAKATKKTTSTINISTF